MPKIKVHGSLSESLSVLVIHYTNLGHLDHQNV